MPVEQWWANTPAAPKPAEIELLRDSHWDFFEGNVMPLLTTLVDHELDREVASQLKQRLRLSNRFRPSQLLWALSQDVQDHVTEALPWVAAAVELSMLARLIDDDVVDQHKTRWGLPSMRIALASDAAAHLISANLRHLAVLCGDRVGPLVLQPDAVSPALCIVEFDRRVCAAMLEELRWEPERFPQPTYDSLALRKVSAGQQVVDLFRFISDPTAYDYENMRTAIRDFDLAAAIDNDMSEVNLLRGLEEIRFPQGERRGDLSELQLGRPSIFSVVLRSETFLERHLSLGLDQPDFRTMDINSIFSTLQDLGAIAAVEQTIDRLKTQGAKALPNTYSRVRTHLALGAAVANLPNDPPGPNPQVFS